MYMNRLSSSVGATVLLWLYIHTCIHVYISNTIFKTLGIPQLNMYDNLHKKVLSKS